MVELYGEMAEQVTVYDLVFMRSGIADFETGSFNGDVLGSPNQVVAVTRC